MVNQSQWLTIRDEVSDWLTNNQAEDKTRVSLQWQSFSLTTHPLFMAVGTSVCGLETVGREMTKVSQFQYMNKFYPPGMPQIYDPMEDLWDALATDPVVGAIIQPLCTEDTAEPLGVTIGGGGVA